MAKEKGKPTMREKEVLEMMINSETEGIGMTVVELAEMRDISYTAARNLLEGLQKKGYIEATWEKKGHKKKYLRK